MAISLYAFVVLLVSTCVRCLPEQGVWTVTYDDKATIHAFPKSIYANTKIYVTVDCASTSDQEVVTLNIKYILRESPCAQEYEGMEGRDDRMLAYLDKPSLQQYDKFDYTKVSYLMNSTRHQCGGDVSHIYLDFGDQTVRTDDVVILSKADTNGTLSKSATTVKSVKAKRRIKRSDPENPSTLPKTTKAAITTTAPVTTQTPVVATHDKTTTQPPPTTTTVKKPDTIIQTPTTVKKHKTTTQPSTTTVKKDETTTQPPTTTVKKDETESVVAKAWKDGCYVFILELKPTYPVLSSSEKKVSEEKEKYKAVVTVRMLGDHGYISAVEFPLEVFYGVMGLVYIGFGIIWIVVLACNWKDLLRVQFWVGGVIVLGMLEKAVFFAEYKSIAETGKSVRGAIILAELVSCMKRTLARMLVIVVSLGFGIVKPRLGQTFHKVLCVGVSYFILGSIEGCMRGLKSKSDQSNELMLAAVPLAVIDAVIVWWIFTSLVQTTRTLRLRRNIVKLSLYRHFTNTLIFAVLASIAFMIWSITQHKLKACTKDWKELWVDEAFWHLLFSVILLIIMILWRPDANNQRYAFSPLLDAAEDEIEEDQLVNDAFDGMKMRGVKGQPNGSPRQKEKSKPDDDLKWVEENIPSSVADKALPSLLDSDEELMNTKFEMSKME